MYPGLQVSHRDYPARQYSLSHLSFELLVFVIFFHPIFLLIHLDEQAPKLHDTSDQGYQETGSPLYLPEQFRLTKTGRCFA